jgi:exopolyphosphatase/guanosine-5'-triphosphate,3'-diphosphate pyrophosphatase
MIKTKRLLPYFAAALLCGCHTTPAPKPVPQDECKPELRAILDVGSGTTKLGISEVNACTGQVSVLRTVDEESVPLPLEANKDKDGKITPEGLKLADEAIVHLKRDAIDRAKHLAPAYKEIRFAAAGTHAFRTATNQGELAARFAAAGIPITALTQEQEAKIGAWAVEACAGRPMLVWDVGGGSMQFTIVKKDGTSSFFGLPLGAEKFKQSVIEDLHLKRNPKCEVQGSTPNPLGKSSAAALALAKAEAAKVPAGFSESWTCTVGIGGVHNKAIEAQIEAKWPKIKKCVCGQAGCAHSRGRYRKEELACLANFFSTKTDCDPEIKGPYSTTSVTNLYLILGFMQAMNIRSVETQDVNMSHGLATDRTLLTFHTEKL